MKELQDTDWMPWGKYGPKQGNPLRMQDVPASYLHHMWTDKGLEHETLINQVANYIHRNLTLLQQEYQNGIW